MKLIYCPISKDKGAAFALHTEDGDILPGQTSTSLVSGYDQNTQLFVSFELLGDLEIRSWPFGGNAPSVDVPTKPLQRVDEHVGPLPAGPVLTPADIVSETIKMAVEKKISEKIGLSELDIIINEPEQHWTRRAVISGKQKEALRLLRFFKEERQEEIQISSLYSHYKEKTSLNTEEILKLLNEMINTGLLSNVSYGYVKVTSLGSWILNDYMTFHLQL